MKIYQLHQCGGEWEDHFDYIVGSYLRKERAEEEKERREHKEKEYRELSRHCSGCPILNDGDDDKIIRMCKKYCDKFMYVDLDDYGFTCTNYAVNWNNAYFRIEEVEVEE